jgi:hypothetical protein
MSVGVDSAVPTSVERREPPLPRARGPVTECLFEALPGSPGELPVLSVGAADPLSDDDLHLALYVCYELHYRGFAGVDERWEWNPSLLALRSRLEGLFESALHERFGHPGPVEPAETTSILMQIATQPGPSVSKYLKDRASVGEFREFLIHKSHYQLKEFDPQSWVIPRLEGKAKAAMLEVAFDEYGCGRAEHIHAELFRNSMEALGLDGRNGAYLDRIPGLNLARANLMTMFGLHRRLAGAAVGHLAIGELTSSLSTKRAADGLRRLGYGPDATHFFDVHVLADSIHDMITLHDLAGGMAAGDPRMAECIVFGAAAGAGLDERFGHFLLGCWDRKEPSLLPGRD